MDTPLQDKDMTVITIYGLSTDSKPTGEQYHQCTFVETDTNKQFLYDKKKGWQPMLVITPSSSSSGSGSCLCIPPLPVENALDNGGYVIEADKINGKIYYCWVDGGTDSLAIGWDTDGNTYTQEEYAALYETDENDT